MPSNSLSQNNKCLCRSSRSFTSFRLQLRWWWRPQRTGRCGSKCWRRYWWCTGWRRYWNSTCR